MKNSQAAKLTSMTTEDIRNRKWTEAEKEAVRRGAAAQAAGDDSGIDYSDISRLTAEQLAGMVRLRDVRRKVPVAPGGSK
jgi:hypothetical protein